MRPCDRAAPRRSPPRRSTSADLPRPATAAARAGRRPRRPTARAALIGRPPGLSAPSLTGARRYPWSTGWWRPRASRPRRPTPGSLAGACHRTLPPASRGTQPDPATLSSARPSISPRGGLSCVCRWPPSGPSTPSRAAPKPARPHPSARTSRTRRQRRGSSAAMARTASATKPPTRPPDAARAAARTSADAPRCRGVRTRASSRGPAATHAQGPRPPPPAWTMRARLQVTRQRSSRPLRQGPPSATAACATRPRRCAAHGPSSRRETRPAAPAPAAPLSACAAPPSPPSRPLRSPGPAARGP
mmetsp:Transcript_70155/g.203447  ORF Transcript_70155/g.203447 Transcript_70155/m.203447 type:complete len:303 (-) Transcript_70155:177-1085(-)